MIFQIFMKQSGKMLSHAYRLGSYITENTPGGDRGNVKVNDACSECSQMLVRKPGLFFLQQVYTLRKSQVAGNFMKIAGGLG